MVGRLPARLNAERTKRLHEPGTTPLLCGNGPGTRMKAERPRRAVDTDAADTCRSAVAGSSGRAFPPPEPLAQRDDETKANERKRLTNAEIAELGPSRASDGRRPRWLRHDAARRADEAFGLEAARVPLGRSRSDVRRLHAWRHMNAPGEAAKHIG